MYFKGFDKEQYPELNIDSYEISINRIELFLKEMKKNIDAIAFDNYKGEFEERVIIEREKTRRQLLEKTFENIFKNEKCVVCFEPTEVKTRCKHYLCVLCTIKIKHKCPICRQKLHHDSDSDSDSESESDE